MKNIIFYLIFLFSQAYISMAATAGINWFAQSQIRTGTQIMINTGNNAFYRATNPPISFSLIYTTPLTSIRSAGVGIVGYNSYITNDFAINNTVQNFTTTSIRITSRVYGDTTIDYLAINYIAVSMTANFVQILVNCRLCTNIKTGKGDRNDTAIGSTIFIGYSTLNVNVYLSSFTLHNSEGLTNYLSAKASIPSGTNIINYQFQVNQNNTVSDLCYVTIIFCKQLTQVLYDDWGKTGSVALSNTSNPSIFPATGPNPDYKDVNRMFFGMSAFKLSRATERNFNLNTTQYANLNTGYSTNFGTYLVQVDFFWIASQTCNNTEPFLDIYEMNCTDNCTASANGTLYSTNPGDYCDRCHYSCLTCNGAYINNCSTCNYNLSRFSNNSNSCPCNTSFIDVGVSLCYPCQNFIPGCNTCSSMILCQSCFPGFVLHPSGVCQCSAGFLVSGICTNITGCTSAVQYSGTTYCVSCNSSLFFETTINYGCNCMAGYYISSNQICLTTCGDAKQVPNQTCDDGNLIDGDGCSSSCTVQSKWICQGGSSTSPSTCLINDNITMVVKYVRRITTANRMQVGLSFNPQYTQLSLANFKQYLTTNVPNNLLNVTYTNDLLIVQFDYSRSIQGEYFDLNLTLNPDVFYNKFLSIQIPASGMNAKLTYDSNNTANYPFQIIVLILDILAIIIMFCTCISQKMIGIQMIQTIQTVLFTQSVMKTTPSSLSPLQMLRYSSGFNQLQGINYSRTYTFAFSLSSIGLQKQFILSYNFMFLMLIATSLFCLIAKMKQMYHTSKVGQSIQQNEQAKNAEKLQKVTKVFNFVFQRILFLFSFMCMFLIIFALMLQLTDMSSSYTIMSKQLNLFGVGVATSILITMVCCVILNGCFPGILLFPMLMKQYYPPTYFIYQTAFIFTLAFNYTQEYTLYILAGMSFCFMIYNMVHRPYSQKIHTFVLVFHQILIMAVIGIFIFQNMTKPTEHEALYKILNGVIVGALYLVVVLNAYRLYRYYRFLQKNNFDQYGNNKLQNQIDDQNFKYSQLKSPKYLNQQQKPMHKKYGTNAPQKLKQKADDIQLQSIKVPKYNNQNSKPKPLIKDQSAMNWKYNTLADQSNNTRLNATNRDARPDTSREKQIVRVKTNQKNLKNNNKNTAGDQQFTIRGNENYQNSQNANANQNDDTIVDNPYDQNGYAKKSKAKNQQDEIQAIKRRLKQDFSSKLKSSTMNQHQ